jgi:hypothetical protein
VRTHLLKLHSRISVSQIIDNFQFVTGADARD